MNMEDRIFEVVIPMEDVIEFKGGRKTVVQKKVFPGYLLVPHGARRRLVVGRARHAGVTGFVGGGAKPTPLSRKEVEDILGVGGRRTSRARRREEGPRPGSSSRSASRCGSSTGPFADFNGAISEINVDRRSSRCSSTSSGGRRPVELEFGQVAKL